MKDKTISPVCGDEPGKKQLVLSTISPVCGDEPVNGELGMIFYSYFPRMRG